MAFTMYASGISPVSRSEDDAMNGLIRFNISIPASWEKAHPPLFIILGSSGRECWHNKQ